MEILEFSRFAVYIFLFLALFIFILFRAIAKLVPVLPLSRKYRQFAQRYLPVVEIFVWLMFFIWAIQFFWNNNQLYSLELSLILTILVLWICWYAFRDYIAGAILRSGRNFEVDERLVIEDTGGRIVSMKNRYLVLETDSGESVFFPYHRIIDKKIIKSSPAESALGHGFKVCPADPSDLPATITELKSFILSLPWSSVKRDPRIHISDEGTENRPVLEVTVYALEKDYFPQIEKYVREQFESGAKD